ncbi:Actin arp-6 [Pyrenophora seminiperda CCB06]|uniref:Actin-like protein ARP6 n=1 Tax=Pyrenophora seminiperda CCB06 TaxID=1302712 RepID=A0A3M7MB73_9PLEO|nr:Actin arp-6 [Pyrenophora seminiperda CCB06]
MTLLQRPPHTNMAPKGSKKATPVTENKTLVLDNGAYTIKAGLVTAQSDAAYNDCSVIPNCIARSTRDKCTYVGAELDACKDFGELAFRRPVEKGFIVNWEAEKAIWEHEFMGEAAAEGLRCDPKETNLLLAEKPNCPKELQKNCDEIVFEQFEFAAYYRCVGATLNAYTSPETNLRSSLPQECLLIIDTSYSDTTILPLYKGKLIQSAVRRLTVGGKLMTNYLKELSSLRHYNMMEETYLLNEIKEAVSYVVPSSQQFAKHLERTWKGRLGAKRELDSSIVVDYVLPDYENAIHGHARPHDAAKSRMRRGLQPQQGPREDLLPLGNERFAVPELLFNPSDIGIQETGIPGAVMESLSTLPEALRVGLLANVVVVGGNSLIAGFMERLETELRALVPTDYLLNVSRAEDAIKHTWLGGANFASQPELLKEVLVTKAEYDERVFGALVMVIGRPAIGAWEHFAARVSREFRNGRLPSPTSTSMRRIPRPSRAIDPSHPLSASLRQRASPLACRSALSPCPHLRTTSAAFSTTTPKAILVPGKPDKKKHQQFVRRWQKRLLGDSEPVGARVDPYDPTSPIRIAPEELGEYEEVLEEEDAKHGSHGNSAVPGYKPASKAKGLLRVGGEKWVKQNVEKDLAKEYEKLTLRTYTPLSLEMANEIEDLTGTPYTLKDGNLMMAQTVHEQTNRPYTEYNFGLHKRITDSKELRSRFTQAVAEVYALKQAGIDMDLSKFANRGVHAAPRWVQDIKLVKTENGDIVLDLPLGKSLEEFVEIMQTVPEWEPVPLDEGVEDELLVEEAGDLLDPVLPQEQLPTMDPATPEHKRAAVHSIFTERAQQIADDFAALKKSVGQSRTRKSTIKAEELTWRQIHITDIAVKFALYKRLYQLTNYRIPDAKLASINNLGDLYHFIHDAFKPHPANLFTAMHQEGQRARIRAKREPLSDSDAKPKRKADLGDLLTLGNVQLLRSKPTKLDKRTKTGLTKVIGYALWERKLTPQPLLTSSTTKIKGKKTKRVVLQPGRKLPQFAKPLSGKGADYLASVSGSKAQKDLDT